MNRGIRLLFRDGEGEQSVWANGGHRTGHHKKHKWSDDSRRKLRLFVLLVGNHGVQREKGKEDGNRAAVLHIFGIRVISLVLLLVQSASRSEHHGTHAYESIAGEEELEQTEGVTQKRDKTSSPECHFPEVVGHSAVTVQTGVAVPARMNGFHQGLFAICLGFATQSENHHNDSNSMSDGIEAVRTQQGAIANEHG